MASHDDFLIRLKALCGDQVTVDQGGFPAIPFFWVNARSKGEIGSGAGALRVHATIGAMGELLERRAIRQLKPAVRNLSFHSLKESGKNVIEPGLVTPFLDEQYRSLPQFLSRFTKETKINWTLYKDAEDSQEILIPFEFTGFSNFQYPVINISTTSGAAIYSDPKTAKLKGLLELIERDQFLIYWELKKSPLKIEIEKFKEIHLQKLYENLELNNKIEFWFLKNDFDVPVICTTLRSRNPKSLPRVLFSCAAGVTVAQAMNRSLNEMAQIYFNRAELNYNFPIGDPKAANYFIYSFLDHIGFNAIWFDFSKCNFWFKSQEPKIIFNDIRDDKEIKLETLVKKFVKKRFKLYFSDLTPTVFKDSGVYVYKAFSPHLAHLYSHQRLRSLGWSRYQQVAKELGLKRSYQKVSDFNSWPHPFP